jgi:hypothetical protein
MDQKNSPNIAHEKITDFITILILIKKEFGGEEPNKIKVAMLLVMLGG